MALERELILPVIDTEANRSDAKCLYLQGWSRVGPPDRVSKGNVMLDLRYPLFASGVAASEFTGMVGRI